MRLLEQVKGDSQKVAVYTDLIIHYSKSNPDSSTYYAEQGLAYCKKNNYRVGEGMIVVQLALLDNYQGRVNIAQQRFLYALEIYKELNYKQGVADVLGNLGALETAKGNMDVGIRDIFASLKLNDSLGNNNGLMVGYMNVGSIYLQQNDTANASKYLSLAEAVSKKIPLTDKTISLYNMIGVLYATKGNTEKALEYFLNDLKLSESPQFIDSHVESLLYLGNFYHDAGDNAKAMQYLREGLKITADGDLPEMKSNILLEIAMMTKEKDPVSAMAYLEEAAAICRKLDNKSFLVTVYSEMVNLYKEQGKFKEALSYTEQKQAVADSVFNINKARELASIAATYELEKSNLKVKDLEILSRKTASQRNVVLFIATGIVFLMIVLLVFYRKTVVLNTQLKVQEKELKELNNTKDKLFSIIGHDLRSPMAMVPSVMDMLEDEDVTPEEKQHLFNSLREHIISSMEMLDKLLFWGQSLVKGIRIQEQNISLKEFIRENIALKKIAAAEKRIEIRDNVPDGLVVHADATHCDFIVRNLLSNAIKYTHDNGKIEISSDTKSKPGFTVFSVKDNGVGIDKELLPTIFNPLYSVTGTANEKGTGIGLMLCKEFVMQNGGNIWVESEAGKGATFYFSLKSAA